MAIPPFPSQDLAKLVLGYLVEEQLMTAYDEFLQASPYLDAYRNEYDRILMTSLKHILAEYRAVKIYVETCKPITLRKKLLQCSNLVDVMSYLVGNFDINKLQCQDVPPDKTRNTFNSSKPGCEMCNSSRGNCMCKSKQTITHLSQASGQSSQLEPTTVECSIEATPLTDLPGNVSRNDYVRVVEKNASTGLLTMPNCETNYESNLIKLSHIASQLSAETNLSNCTYTTVNNLHSSSTPSALPTKSSDLNKIEEFDNVLRGVIAENNSEISKRMSNAGTFNDFASGVHGADNINTCIRDSSSAENVTMIPQLKQVATKKTKSSKKTAKGPQLLLTVSYPDKKLNRDDVNCNSDNGHIIANSVHKKSEEHKVTILSDVRVEKSANSVQPSVLANATSTPLMQMQTILINGTPAYKHRVPPYTKDEIMAMPTIILVPTSAPPSIPPGVITNATNSKKTTTTVSTSTNICPITIDISADSPVHPVPDKDDSKSSRNPTYVNESNSNISTLVKTADVYKNASVPKDNVVSVDNKSSTPHVLPVLRKASSTPRRNTHIRVLDFTTPRRILHETINEIVPNENPEGSVEVVISRSANLAVPETSSTEKIATLESGPTINEDVSKSNNSTKENVKKKNWDADLRALCAGSPLSPKSRPKPKRTSSKKKKIVNSQNVNTENESQKKVTNKGSTASEKRQKKVSPKTKSAKKKSKPEAEPIQSTSTINIKPTINIISNSELSPSVVHGNQKSQNLSQTLNKSDDKDKSNSDDRIDTPEMERLSLHNVIGSKLNISDILETPYKQALYDIQMETPRFLGPDLPDDPMSDIKIMNIPTPRFFDTPNLALTPKAMQATPSSYSSRPTDYSSGSSYYKPDDYMPIPDLRPAPSIAKEKQVTEKIIIEIPPKDEPNKQEKPSRRRSTRPIRQCTKNVSYRNSPNVKHKTEDRIESGSSCSDTQSINSSCDIDQKEIARKVEAKPSSKSDNRKPYVFKKKLTPIKKGTPRIMSKVKSKTPISTSKYIRSPLKIPSRGRGRPKLITYEKSYTPAVVPLPTKSRRKSSTPRKLHCTKAFVAESSGDSKKVSEITTNDLYNTTLQDSDAEQPALRWSDDCSQDTKVKETTPVSPINGCEDIFKIKQFIETTKPDPVEENKLHADLVKKGIDTVTAINIERDLQDVLPSSMDQVNKISETQIQLSTSDKTLESDCSAVLQIVQDENDDVEEIEFSIHECNETTNNFMTYKFDDAKETKVENITKLKDTFCMEVCIEDGVDVMLRATSLVGCFDMDPIQDECIGYSFSETEAAVNSISNYDRLYTPLKNAAKTQFYDIFDSTLTSLDTPLKPNSPSQRESETTVTEIVLEVEQIVEKTEVKKRKRESVCSDESTSESKKSRPEAQYLLNSASIQNIDIESVLSKLHGP